MPTRYDPAASHDIEVTDVPFRSTPKRQLMARVYRPRADRRLAVVLDLHGGAWNEKDRLANAPMDEALARSGLLVVAVDLTLGAEAPYPASVQDAHYGVRWLKARAAEWGGDAATLGVLGSSSGGHIAQLIGMRPSDPRYGALALEGHPGLDASVRYVATRSPISDPYARYLNAEARQRSEMMRKSKTYFDPWDSVFEGNPQRILERGEAERLPPMLIMQGGLDDNVLPEIQQKFAETYRAAGGACKLEVFEGCGHIWVADPGPQTERAHEMVKAFIAGALDTID